MENFRCPVSEKQENAGIKSISNVILNFLAYRLVIGFASQVSISELPPEYFPIKPCPNDY